MVNLLAFAVAELVVVYSGAVARGEVGYDAWLYLDEITSRWLATGEMYYPVQFGRTYTDAGIVNLYPPVAMYLFAPMSVLPRVLWWAIPLGVLAWHVWVCRPAPWTWPLFALAACTVKFPATIVYGNTEMWTMALLAIAVRHHAVAWFLVMKPTVIPYALLFARDRRWWPGPALLLLMSVPLGTLWIDWFEAMRNVEASPLRSLSAVPLLAVPILAWLSRSPRHGRLEAAHRRSPDRRHLTLRAGLGAGRAEQPL